MPIKVGLKHIEIWNDSMEKAVCKYEEEPIHKGEEVGETDVILDIQMKKVGNSHNVS